MIHKIDIVKLSDSLSILRSKFAKNTTVQKFETL